MINQYGFVDRSSSLSHHGVMGMKWGVRKQQPQSFQGRARRAYAKVFDVNQRYYSKRNSSRARMLANANRRARDQQLKKAEEADRRKRELQATKKPKNRHINKTVLIGGSAIAAKIAVDLVFRKKCEKVGRSVVNNILNAMTNNNENGGIGVDPDKLDRMARMW